MFSFASVSDITGDFGYLGRGGERLGGIEMCTSTTDEIKGICGVLGKH